jgi:hypothetical protein
MILMLLENRIINEYDHVIADYIEGRARFDDRQEYTAEELRAIADVLDKNPFEEKD